MTREQQIASIKAEVASARIVAMKKFKADWGTDSVKDVMMALRETIPNSASPKDAAAKARALLDKMAS